MEMYSKYCTSKSNLEDFLEIRPTLEDYLKAMEPLNNSTVKKEIIKSEIAFKKVIFNGPATIVFWNDGTKTVVKCTEGDPYSKEAGFALCVLKKLTGDRFHRVLRNACGKED